MASFAWQERVAEIDAELAEPDGKPLPGYEDSYAYYATKRRADLQAERAAILADPEKWAAQQEAWEASIPDLPV